MGVIDKVKGKIMGILNPPKVIELSKLPSQGLFYEEEFFIKYNKVVIGDILVFNNNKDDTFFQLLFKIKKIVSKCVVLPKGYKFEDILNIDLFYVFFKIANHTNGNNLIPYVYSDKLTKFFDVDEVFDYFDTSNIISNYNKGKRCFEFNGWEYRLPKIGTQISLYNFLENNKSYGDISFNFLFFIGNRNMLSNEDFVNIISLFNVDMSEEDTEEVTRISYKMDGFNLYKFNKGEFTLSNVDMKNIFTEKVKKIK